MRSCGECSRTSCAYTVCRCVDRAAVSACHTAPRIGAGTPARTLAARCSGARAASPAGSKIAARQKSPSPSRPSAASQSPVAASSASVVSHSRMNAGSARSSPSG
ncbi:hypothetical protein GGH95_001917 [Coemansia sp. RSA 1836]|nr:hypothetical protein GGH95_001917 [Coemansia sp. RSA 1836]